jgi:hypothetical protein
MVVQQVSVHIVARGSWSSNGHGSIVHFPARLYDVSRLQPIVHIDRNATQRPLVRIFGGVWISRTRTNGVLAVPFYNLYPTSRHLIRSSSSTSPRHTRSRSEQRSNRVAGIVANRRNRYQQLLGCSSVNLTNTTNLYARYTQTVLCNSIVQNSVTPCSLSGNSARPVCAETCVSPAKYGQSIPSS